MGARKGGLGGGDLGHATAGDCALLTAATTLCGGSKKGGWVVSLRRPAAPHPPRRAGGAGWRGRRKGACVCRVGREGLGAGRGREACRVCGNEGQRGGKAAVGPRPAGTNRVGSGAAARWMAARKHGRLGGTRVRRSKGPIGGARGGRRREVGSRRPRGGRPPAQTGKGKGKTQKRAIQNGGRGPERRSGSAGLAHGQRNNNGGGRWRAGSPARPHIFFRGPSLLWPNSIGWRGREQGSAPGRPQPTPRPRRCRRPIAKATGGRRRQGGGPRPAAKGRGGDADAGH